MERLCRRSFKLIVDMSTPSILNEKKNSMSLTVCVPTLSTPRPYVILPLMSSWMRNKVRKVVDLPAPVRPIMPGRHEAPLDYSVRYPTCAFLKHTDLLAWLCFKGEPLQNRWKVGTVGHYLKPARETYNSTTAKTM